MKKAKKALEQTTDPQEKERLEEKMAGHDAMQLVYKELMNSTYGKLIQKTPQQLTLDIDQLKTNLAL